MKDDAHGTRQQGMFLRLARQIPSARLKLFLKVGLSSALLLFATTLVDWQKFPVAIRGASLGWVAATIAVWFAYQWLSAALTSRLLAIRISSLRVWRVNLISTYFGFFLPGEVVAGLASRLRYLGIPDWPQVVVLTLVERLTVFIAMSLGAALLVRTSRFWPSYGLAILAASMIVVTGSFIGLWLLTSENARPYLRRLPGGKRLASLDHISPSLSIQACMLAVAIACLSGLVAYLLLRALHSDVTYADAFIFSFATTVITLLPVSFAGIGVRDLSAIALLGTIGVSREVALLSSMFGLLLLVMSALVGGLLQIDAERKRS